MEWWLILLQAVIAAIAAFTFNLAHWYITENRRSANSSGEYLNQIIEALIEKSFQYWMNNYEGEKNQSKLRLEIEIIGYLKLLAKVNSKFLKALPNKMDSTDEIQLRDFPGKLYDLVTGGSFQSERIEPDHLKCQRINSLCTKAVSVIKTTSPRFFIRNKS